MSTLKVTNLQHASSGSASITLDSGGTASFNGKDVSGIASINGGQIGGANLVQNGAMTISQRGTSTTGVGDGTVGYLTVDRFRFQKAGSPTARYTMTQDTDGPDGFSNSLKLEVTTADTSVGASEHQYIDQFIEAQNLQHLAWDTASSGKSVTLSFYVKCSTAQTFAVDFINEDNSRYFNTTYTVSAASTWEKKTITLPADASNGFNNDNGRGLRVRWTLAAGSDLTDGSVSTAWSGTQHTATNHENTWIGATGRTWQLTGIQLETGSQATDFQHEDVGTTLQKCQRYYFKHKADEGNDPILGTASNWSTTGVYSYFQFPVQMRTAPSGSYSAASDFIYYIAGATKTPSSIGLSARVTNYAAEWDISSSGLTAGQAGWMRAANGNAYIEYDAEL